MLGILSQAFDGVGTETDFSKLKAYTHTKRGCNYYVTYGAT